MVNQTWIRLGRLSDVFGVIGVSGLSAMIATLWAATSSNSPASITSVGWLGVFFAITITVVVSVYVAALAVDKWRSIFTTSPAQSSANLGETKLRIRYFSDERTPTTVEQANIWRWYSLNTQLHGVDAVSQEVKVIGILTTLFVLFDAPVLNLHQIVFSSPDFRLPSYEVKDSGPRHCIVVFANKLPEGDMDIRVRTAI